MRRRLCDCDGRGSQSRAVRGFPGVGPRGASGFDVPQSGLSRAPRATAAVSTRTDPIVLETVGRAAFPGASADGLAALETPCLLLDADRLERNCARLRERLRPHGVRLRQHVKTAKCEQVARLAAGGVGPITVSTLKEADRFAEAGWRDILYAVGIVPAKLPHVARLRARGVDLKVVLDSVEAAQALREAAPALLGAASDAARLPVLIEIDCDGHRAGVRPDDADTLLSIGRLLESSATTLAGVMTHAGASYDCRSLDAIAEMAERERAAIVRAADALTAAGLPCPIRSVGSTPTALMARRLDGITEVRAGVYQFFDLVMAGLGVCAVDDIALSVLASVVGHQPERGWTIVDAGWMAMSRDRGTAAQPVDQGYGLACTVDGRPLDDLVMAQANQEHGILGVRDASTAAPSPSLSPSPSPSSHLPVGSLVRILPNHACATAAQHDRYHLVRDGRVEAVWMRFSGW